MQDQHIDRVCRLRFGQQHLLYVDQWVLQHGGDIQALEIASEALLSEVWFRSLPQLVQHIRSGCAWRIFVESDRVFWCADGVEKNRDLEWRGKLASFELLEKGCVLVDIYLLTITMKQWWITWFFLCYSVHISKCVAPIGSSRKNHRQDQAILPALVHSAGIQQSCQARYGTKCRFHQDCHSEERCTHRKERLKTSLCVMVCLFGAVENILRDFKTV